jgi:hypothetical protein
MGLTTIFDNHLGWFTEIQPSVKALFSTRIGRLGTSLDTLPISGVRGSRVQAGEAWDSLSRWKYAIQAASEEMTARPAENAVGNAGSLSMREAGIGKQTLRQAVRLAASEAYAKRRREPAEREKLAIEVLTALGERDATTITATEQRAGAALPAMITDESLTASEAVQRCAGAIGHREAARLRQLAAQAHNNKPENDSTRAAEIR